jgi:hypothetical protein
MNSSTLPPIPKLIVKMSISALPLLLKLDDDNLAVKTASTCSAEQPPLSPPRSEVRYSYQYPRV